MGIERFTPCKHNWKYPDCPFCVMDERMDALEEMIQNLYDEISSLSESKECPNCELSECKGDCMNTFSHIPTKANKGERDEDGITLDA